MPACGLASLSPPVHLGTAPCSPGLPGSRCCLTSGLRPTPCCSFTNSLLRPAALLGLSDCGPEGSHHGGNGAAAALAAAGPPDSCSPKPPAAKKLRLQLPGSTEAARDGTAGEGGRPHRPSLLSAAAVTGAAVPSISVPRLERELEKALKAFIRVK